MKLYYRLFETDDPEERLEDAALWKALADEFGDGIIPLEHGAKAPEDGYLLGRGKKMEFSAKLPVSDDLPYWTDPAFLNACGRSFRLCDWNEAKAEVDRLHSEGKGAFVKSIKAKHYIERVPVGVSLADAADAMAFSFMDLPPCLMVQELVDMAFERRFVVIDRQVVTSSPIAVHLTPIDTGKEHAHFRTPNDRLPWMYDRKRSAAMHEMADSIAKTMATPHAIVDLAESRGAIVAVEFNPARIGQFGLYACDVRKIAKAVRVLIAADYDAEATATEKNKPNIEWSIEAAQARVDEMFKGKEVCP